ncbi:hypothetical protein CsSME_00009395 [Camellia sinensis var. sinensis]
MRRVEEGIARENVMFLFVMGGRGSVAATKPLIRHPSAQIGGLEKINPHPSANPADADLAD